MVTHKSLGRCVIVEVLDNHSYERYYVYPFGQHRRGPILSSAYHFLESYTKRELEYVGIISK